MSKVLSNPNWTAASIAHTPYEVHVEIGREARGQGAKLDRGTGIDAVRNKEIKLAVYSSQQPRRGQFLFLSFRASCGGSVPAFLCHETLLKLPPTFPEATRADHA
jgi:hypothetical protein